MHRTLIRGHGGVTVNGGCTMSVGQRREDDRLVPGPGRRRTDDPDARWSGCAIRAEWAVNRWVDATGAWARDHD